jgi:hypothetical protein
VKYELTLDEINARLVVDTTTGKAYWRDPTKHHKRLTGLEAGSIRRDSKGYQGYWMVKINGRGYKRAHIVFAVTHGYWPKEQVDHINCNSLDDRASNLREVTVLQNAWNRKKVKRTLPLPMGVRQSRGRFAARITHNKRQIPLGGYATPEEASAVYQRKRKELFGEYS